MTKQQVFELLSTPPDVYRVQRRGFVWVVLLRNQPVAWYFSRKRAEHTKSDWNTYVIMGYMMCLDRVSSLEFGGSTAINYQSNLN